jgi:hypothetical protein
MEVPVTAKAPDGVEHKCITRDISAGSVFFFCDAAIMPNSPIDIVMILPPEFTGGEKQWVCCHGQVVRVEADAADGQHGVAVRVERLEFLPELSA